MTEAFAPAPPSSDRAPRSIHPAREPGAQPEATGLRGWYSRVLPEPNAIWMREMRQSARLARTPWVLLSLVLAPTLLLSTIGGLAASSSTTPAELGGMLFQTFFSIAYFVVIDRMVIPLEEYKLERIFGAQYVDYKTRVRRWL